MFTLDLNKSGTKNKTTVYRLAYFAVFRQLNLWWNKWVTVFIGNAKYIHITLTLYIFIYPTVGSLKFYSFTNSFCLHRSGRNLFLAYAFVIISMCCYVFALFASILQSFKKCCPLDSAYLNTLPTTCFVGLRIVFAFITTLWFFFCRCLSRYWLSVCF